MAAHERTPLLHGASCAHRHWLRHLLLPALPALPLAAFSVRAAVWSAVAVIVPPGVCMLLFAGFCETPWEACKLTANAVASAYGSYRARGCRTRFPEWSLAFELLTAAMRVCTRTHGHRIVLPSHAQYIRRESEVAGTMRGWASCWYYNYTLESVCVLGMEHLWLRAKPQRSGDADRAASRLVVLYLHGGGYSALSPRFHIAFCAALARGITERLAETVKVDVFVANYRKAPEQRYPTAEQDVLAMFDYILEKECLRPEEVLLCGDCTGAELALAAMLRLRRERGQSALPIAAILACPVVDVAALCQDELEDVSAEYCILAPRMMHAIGNGYLPTAELRTAWYRHSSALNPDHDLNELPPVFVQAGGLDYLRPHAQWLVDKARSVDGAKNWELDVHEHMPHVFTSFPAFLLPYASVGIERMVTFAARVIINHKNQSTTTNSMERGRDSHAPIAA